MEGIELIKITIPTEDANLIDANVSNFAKTVGEMTHLYAKKNHDYGDSFNKGMNTIGMAYGVGRLYDKMNRIITLTQLNPFDKPQVKDEAIQDTLLDLACYAVMTYNFITGDKTPK